jgi:hypothetical protein
MVFFSFWGCENRCRWIWFCGGGIVDLIDEVDEVDKVDRIDAAKVGLEIGDWRLGIGDFEFPLTP